MAIGGAFLGGGVEVVPAGSCKLELEILTEDRANLAATFTIKGTSTYTVTAGADGRAVYTVPSGQTYTVSVNTTGYDNIASQTVVAESGTVRYVRFEAFAGRVKRSGDTMTGTLTTVSTGWVWRIYKGDYDCKNPTTNDNRPINLSVQEKNGLQMMNDFLQCTESSTRRIINTFYRDTSGNETKRCSLVMELSKNGNPYITAPTPTNPSSNSTAIATTAWVNGASSVVHRSGDEEIQGVKTFSFRIVEQRSSDMGIEMLSTSFDRSATFTSYQRPVQFIARDKNGNTLMSLQTYAESNNRRGLDLILNDMKGNQPMLSLKSDGSKTYATAPTTPTNATSNEIATANWSIGKFVQKSGDTMTGGLAMQFLTVAASLDKNTTKPSATTNALMTFRAKDGSQIGGIANFTQANGNRVTYMKTVGIDGTTEKRLDIWHLPDNTAYLTFPSWSIGTNDNSDKILTIAMANKLPSLVHTSDDEIINGLKVFNSTIWRSLSDNSAGLIMNHTKAKGSTETYYNDIVWRDSSIYRAYIRCNLFPDGESVQIVPRNATGGYAGEPLTVKWTSTKGMEVHVPYAPDDSNGVNAANTSWVRNRLVQKNKMTNVTSYTQLMDLIKNGKRGDSFGITMDYVGGSIGGITAYDREVHAFGHYTIDEITVSDGALTGLQAFGSGEVSGKLKNDDDTTYTYATTGFGRQAIGNGVIDALRVVEDGKLTYFAPNDDSASISAFEGYYISI